MPKEFPKDLRTIIIAHLRRIGYRNVTYKKNMGAAHRGLGEWQCAGCGAIVSRAELHGDHRDPVIDPEKGFEDWNTFMERLFLGDIQPLCKSRCHAEKTKAENKIRKAKRDERKDWEDV